MECPQCHTRTMVRRLGATDVYYECACGGRVPGTSHDRRISSGGQTDAQQHEKYATIIGNAPFSPTMLRVRRPCDNCGLPYMTQVRVSENETIVHVCECSS